MATLKQEREQKALNAENARKARNTTNRTDEAAPFSLSDAEQIINQAASTASAVKTRTDALSSNKDKMTPQAIKSEGDRIRGSAMQAAMPLTTVYSQLDEQAKRRASTTAPDKQVAALRDKAGEVMRDLKSTADRVASLNQEGPKPGSKKDEKKLDGPSARLG